MSVLRPSAHSTTTSPPRPPSPPSGPPNSMNFSRRNETHPAPPSPERTRTLAWSRNFMSRVWPSSAALCQSHHHAGGRERVARLGKQGLDDARVEKADLGQDAPRRRVVGEMARDRPPLAPFAVG